jgi:hypothetical protein
MAFASSTLEALHRQCIRHRSEIESAARCGCFNCGATFGPGDITDWVDEGTTALCPRCGIDSLLPEQASQPLTPALLEAMHEYWFERTVHISATSTLWRRIQLRLEPLLRRWSWFRRSREEDA